jgi:hypothetical protein
MVNARVLEAEPIATAPGQMTLRFGFKSWELIAGSSYQPGPPPDAPPVDAVGPNMGWAIGLSPANRRLVMPMAVLDFTAPHYDGRLLVLFERSPRRLQRFLRENRPLRHLILVLPDRPHRSYVEFKLWNVRASSMPTRSASFVFEAPMIERLDP